MAEKIDIASIGIDSKGVENLLNLVIVIAKQLKKSAKETEKAGKDQERQLSRNFKLVRKEIKEKKKSQRFEWMHQTKMGRVYKGVKEYFIRKRKYLKEVNKLEYEHNRIAQDYNNALKARYSLARRGFEVKTKKSGMVGEVAKDAGAAVLGKTMKTLGRVIGKIAINPLWDFLSRLLDFDEEFRFNREVNKAVGGIDALRGSLRTGTLQTSKFAENIWEMGDALKGGVEKYQFLINAEERLAAIRGLEVSAAKSREYLDTLGEGVNDITVQIVGFSRTLGMDIQEVSSYMGQLVFDTAETFDTIAKSFSGFIADATEAGISQRRFLDAIRASAAQFGLYTKSLSGASLMLADMTQHGLAPAGESLAAFQQLISEFKGMDIARVGVNMQIAMEDAGFGETLDIFRQVITTQVPAAISERLGGSANVFARLMQADRTEGENNFVRVINEMAQGDKEQQQALMQTYRQIEALRAMQHGDILTLQDVIARGAVPPQIMISMLDAVARSGAIGAENLASLLPEQLLVMQETSGLTSDLLRTMGDMGLSQEEANAQLIRMLTANQENNAALSTLQDLQQQALDALEGPQKTFQGMVEELLRTIRKILIELVRELMPVGIDLLTTMLEVLAGVAKGVIMMAENFVDTGAVGAAIWNAASKVAGGTTYRTTEDWYDEGDVTGRVGRRDTVVGALQQGTIEMYRSQARAVDQQMTDRINTMRNMIGSIRRTLEEDELTDAERAKLGESLDTANQAFTDLSEQQGRMAREAANSWREIGENIRGGRGLFNATNAKEIVDEYQNVQGQIDSQFESYMQRISQGIRTLIPQATEARLPTSENLFAPGHAAGGIVTAGQIARIAERQPEAVIPLTKVPEVFARTIKASGAQAGGGPSVSIGNMSFTVPPWAAQDKESFASFIRQVITREFQAMLLKGRR